MALNYFGYRISVISEGEYLEPYKVQVSQDDRTVSCYIASEVGKEFEIKWIDASNNPSTVLACYMDGKPVGGMPSHPGLTGRNAGLYTSVRKQQPFKFSQLIVTDNEDIADPDSVNPDLGSIQIEVHRTQSVQPARALMGGRSGRAVEAPPVHERSKKAGSHAVSLGQARRTNQPSQFMKPRYLDSGPYAVFCFYYRPRALLMAQGIIPNIPIPALDVLDQKPVVGNGYFQSANSKRTIAALASDNDRPKSRRERKRRQWKNEDEDLVNTPTSEIPSEGASKRMKSSHVEDAQDSAFASAGASSSSTAAQAGPSVSIKRESSLEYLDLEYPRTPSPVIKSEEP